MLLKIALPTKDNKLSKELLIVKNNGCQSPVKKLNNFQYHDNWLQNLNILFFKLF